MRDRKDDQHRRVAEAKVGRKLQPNEVSHHRDENKANNTSANIEVSTRGQHTAEHNKARGLSKLRKALRRTLSRRDGKQY
jgi:hypothetical protein